MQNLESSYSNLIDFFLSNLPIPKDDKERFNYLLLFVTTLQKIDKSISSEKILEIYNKQKADIGRIPTLTEFVSFLELNKIINYELTIKTLINIDVFKKVIHEQYGENVSINYRVNISQNIDIDTINLMMKKIFGTGEDNDNRNIYESGYLSLITSYRFLPGYIVEEGDSEVIELMVSDFSNEGLKDIIDGLKSQGYKNIILSILTQEEFNNCITVLENPADRYLDDALIEIGGNVLESTIDDDSSIGKAFNAIVTKAIDIGASDIHITPGIKSDEINIRYRVFDSLKSMDTQPLKLLSYFERKILKDGNVSQSGVPEVGLDLSIIQKGIEVGGKKYSYTARINFSKVVSVEGQKQNKIVMRIVDLAPKASNGKIMSYTDLGMTERDSNLLKKIVKKPNGLILTVGPTGSGKTNTLYCVMENLIKEEPDKCYVTIEDPVERPLAGADQHEINESAGYTFAVASRSVMREDPDTALIGELRDNDTADTAMKLAGTGHLVFSTLHTNTSVQTLTRLTNLGTDNYDIYTYLLGVISQRLVSKPCPHCAIKEKGKILNEKINQLSASDNVEFRFNEDMEYIMEVGKGCEQCNNVGVIGRIGIFEILIINRIIRDLISKKASMLEIYDTIWDIQKEKKGDERFFISMLEDGLVKCSKGLAPFNEVMSYEDSLGLS